MTKNKTSIKLQDKLIEFGIATEISKINDGPIISIYRIDLAPGVSVRKIKTLEDDLTFALDGRMVRVVSATIETPYMTAEVVNEKRKSIAFNTILKATSKDFKLPIPLGVYPSGDSYAADLAALPHLLVAGRTGAGKSVLLNCIICGLVKEVKDLELILIDPKMVEFNQYKNLDSLIMPVADSSLSAIRALEKVVSIMVKRYEDLKEAGVKNIADYKDDMNYLVIIIDEFADLMMTSKKAVESHIVRISQIGRAVGVHLVVATQRPTVNVITGLIKANMPSRIALQVTTKIDSRVVLDQNGAQALLDKGDMLFMSPKYRKPIRLHGAYISDPEIQKIIEPVSNQTDFKKDEKMSIIDIQRKRNVGYLEAKRIMEDKK